MSAKIDSNTPQGMIYRLRDFCGEIKADFCERGCRGVEGVQKGLSAVMSIPRFHYLEMQCRVDRVVGQ